jgi:acyl-coenzyme A synthetase/AMP-(fatty) acid ligase
VNRAWFRQRLADWGDREALAGTGGSLSYAGLLSLVAQWNDQLNTFGVTDGRVVAFEASFRPESVALLLALLDRNAIAVPLVWVGPRQWDDCLSIARVESVVDEVGTITDRGPQPGHPLLERLVASGRPGLVLFSSGSTGEPKGMLHDLDLLLERYQRPRPPTRILAFLLPDHIGGVNTLLAGLSSGSTVIHVSDRRPATVCKALAQHRVTVLPTSPTFLNLLLLSEEHRRHDLSSLQTITYGTEPMPASTLERLRQEFPGVRLHQTYGLSELGILKSRSRDDGSLWVQVGGEGYQTRVADGILWIKARTAMLGYLNAESPFDADGWFCTQDVVEQDGDWIRFLGRASELINVGGQKVHPAEVESALLTMEGVNDVTVHGEPNPLLGQCVVARVNLSEPESPLDFKARMRRHCHGRLAAHMVPMKVEVVSADQFNIRFKRMRQALRPE